MKLKVSDSNAAVWHNVTVSAELPKGTESAISMSFAPESF